jgi:hypothetical protein
MRVYIRVWSSRKWFNRRKSYEKKIFDFSYRDRHRENDESIIIRRIVESFWNEEMWAIHSKLHLRQCFNCQKYDHIDKHCKTAVICDTCAKEHRTSDCDLNIIDKHKWYDECKNREHIAWISNCKVKIKKRRRSI